MKFEHYLNKLHESKEFKDFKKEHKRAYLAAGFFIIDLEEGKNQHQIDYSLPNGKIATFTLDDGIKLKMSEQAMKGKMPKLPEEIKIDLDALKGIVHDEMRNRIVTEDIKKIIAILHINDNKTIWNLQCILSGLGILNVHVDDSDESVLKFEKFSMMDIIKQIPGKLNLKDIKEIKPESKQEEKSNPEKK